jgi:hypothetical protein
MILGDVKTNPKLVPSILHFSNASLYNISANGWRISLSIKAIIYHIWVYIIYFDKMWYYYIFYILVNNVPVLSNEILFVIFIFSKTPLFFIKMPLFVAKLRTIAITEGTARPKAHGHDATSTPMPLSTIQQMAQNCSIYTILVCIKTAHTTIVNILNKTTALTKTLAMDLHTACIPSTLSFYWFCENLICVPISTSIDFSKTFSIIAMHYC